MLSQEVQDAIRKEYEDNPVPEPKKRLDEPNGATEIAGFLGGTGAVFAMFAGFSPSVLWLTAICWTLALVLAGVGIFADLFRTSRAARWIVGILIALIVHGYLRA